MSIITKFPVFKEYCISCKKLLKINRKWLLWCNGCKKKGLIKYIKILDGIEFKKENNATAN